MNRILRLFPLLFLFLITACDTLQYSKVTIVVNNTTQDILRFYVNGNLVGNVSPGPQQFTVNVQVDYNYSNSNCVTCSYTPDHATVYVSAYNTKLGKSSRTQSLYVETDRVSWIDFTKYDFQY